MFGMEFVMPPAEAMRGDVIEYRCPYITKCPAVECHRNRRL